MMWSLRLVSTTLHNNYYGVSPSKIYQVTLKRERVKGIYLDVVFVNLLLLHYLTVVGKEGKRTESSKEHRTFLEGKCFFLCINFFLLCRFLGMKTAR